MAFRNSTTFFRKFQDVGRHQVLARLVARDVRTTTARNLRLLRDCSGLNPWKCSGYAMKEALKTSLLVEVPDEDQWRLSYLCNLITQRRQARSSGLEEEEGRIDSLIHSLVKN